MTDDRSGSRAADGSITFTVPLEITLHLGTAVPASAPELASTAAQPHGTGDATSRARAALAQGPITYRNHFVSLYQSAVNDIARKIAAERRTGIESLSTDDAADLMLAAQAVAQSHVGPQALSQPGPIAPSTESMLEQMSTVAHARACASLGWQLMQAKVLGDTQTVDRVKSELDGSTCDPRWAETMTEYAGYFGVGGTRKEPLYVTPAQAGENVIVIKKGARIGLIGDWGTGAAPAQAVLQQLKLQNPDILIHLGDIYYSGTPDECVTNFETIVNRVFDRPTSKLPVYTLSGNHDMYCGGVGYYPLIRRLNAGIDRAPGSPMVQPASFFCLRAEDDSWQILAMDTGRHDFSPFSVTDVLTFIDPAEQDWLARRMQEFKGKTILLSHHQLFSAFSQIGQHGATGRFNPINPKLSATYAALTKAGGKIAAWFWGHEHNLCIYQSYAGLDRGRCLGHSAIPVFVEDAPYQPLTGVDDPPRLVPGTTLSNDGTFYTHGYAVLSLGSGGTATADYFEDVGGAARKIFSEAIA